MLLVHIFRDGVVLVPPFPASKIPRLLHAGSVLPDDYYWHEGMTAWDRVSRRWEAEANPAPESAVTLSPLPGEPRETPPITTPAAEPQARRNRTSLLHEAKKRYYETIFPWSTTAKSSPSCE